MKTDMYTWKSKINQDVVTENVLGISIHAYSQRPKHLVETLEKNAKLYPTKAAIIDGDTRLSYQGFYQQVINASKSLLHELLLKPGQRLAVIQKNTSEFCIMTYAALMAGLIVVPINTKLKPGEMATLLKDAEVSAILPENDEQRDKLGSLLEFSVQFVDRSCLYRTEDSKESIEFPQLDEHDIAFIMYTSGTTGNPKGVMLSHFNAIHCAINYERCYGLTAEDKTIIAVPIFHGTGLMAQLITFLYLGGTVVLLNTFNANNMLLLCKQEQVSHTICTPTVYNLLLQEPDYRNFKLKLRVLGVGGAPITGELFRRIREWLPDADLLNTYGLTEATSPALMTPKDMAPFKIGSVGIASPIMECQVVDFDSHYPAPPRQSGEIWIKGALITRGYWRNGEATRKAITDGWLHTGDVGWMDEDGFVYVCDRIKDMINRGGEKIYSTEVEDVISNHPDVLEVAAVGEPDPLYGEVVKVFVVPKNGKILRVEDIIGWASARLAKYKVPKYVEFRDSLPRNAGGKVLKRSLLQANK